MGSPSDRIPRVPPGGWTSAGWRTMEGQRSILRQFRGLDRPATPVRGARAIGLVLPRDPFDRKKVISELSIRHEELPLRLPGRDSPFADLPPKVHRYIGLREHDDRIDVELGDHEYGPPRVELVGQFAVEGIPRQIRVPGRRCYR